MSEQISGQELSRGLEAPTDTRPVYTFSFGTARATGSIEQDMRGYMSLVPDALLEVWSEEQYNSAEDSGARSVRLFEMAYRADSVTVTEGAAEVEEEIKYVARKRHYPGIYEMQTNTAVDLSAKAVMASTHVREAFRLLNATSQQRLNKRETRAILLEGIDRLNAAVRSGLGAETSDYGGLLKIENLPMTSELPGEAAESQVQRAYLVVPQSRSEVMKKTSASPGALKDILELYWSNALSFVDVKADSSEDLIDPTLWQSLRHVGTICQRWTPTSHVHFVTWCGNLVRLWLVNSTLYGCSRLFDTKDTNDQEEIIKILRLVNLEEHRSQLCDHWDLAAAVRLDLKPQTVNRSGITSIDTTGLRELEVRSGPFGSRTAVFVEEGAGDKRTMLKVSWVEEPLEFHEWTMMCGLQELSAESRLPYAPEPIGLVDTTSSDFQAWNSETLLGAGPAPHFPSRVVCALATKQYLGDRISSQVPPHHLVHIHMELAEQLLILASHGYHYRDLNEGNILLLKGSEKTLLIIDMGNMRKNLSPRGRSGLTDVQAVLDRASDDTRSANELFLPTCYVDVKYAIIEWNNCLTAARAVVHGRSDTRASVSPEDKLKKIKKIKEAVNHLRAALKAVAMHSHRYIDDLESAVYLHFWRTANYYGMTVQLLAELMELLKIEKKQKLWQYSKVTWEQDLNKYCRKASEEWIQLMCDLRIAILDARTKLNVALADVFEANDRLHSESLEADVLMRSWDPSVDVDHMIYEIFDNRGLLKETGLHPIERECFEKCIKLLREGEIKMEAKALSA